MKGIFLKTHQVYTEEPDGNPMEQDIPVGEDDTGTMPDPDDVDSNVETDEEDDMGFDMGDEGSDEFSDNETSDYGGSDSYGDSEGNSSIDPENNSKKRKLFDNYTELLNLVNSLLDLNRRILTTDLSKGETLLLKEMNKTLESNKEKLEYVIEKRFLDTNYQKLLTIFLYIKATIQEYAKLLKIFDKEV